MDPRRVELDEALPPIAMALDAVSATELVMDGEVISANEKGAASFSQLQDDLSKISV